MFIVQHHFLVARAPLLHSSPSHTHMLSLSTETSPRAYTCSVPCINGSCARMTNSWPVIQMPRFRIIARHAPQKQHPSRTLTKQTNHSLQAKGKRERDTETRAGRSKGALAEPIEASQHRKVVVAASPTDHAAKRKTNNHQNQRSRAPQVQPRRRTKVTHWAVFSVSWQEKRKTTNQLRSRLTGYPVEQHRK